VAHAVLRDHIARLKEDIQAIRNLKNREECMEKGRRENALRAFEEDRRRVKERREKEKETIQSPPQEAWGAGVVGSRSTRGNESPLSYPDDEF
jgi:hypothetical protein